MPTRPVPALEGFETLAEVKKRFAGFDAARTDAPPVVQARFIAEVLLNSARITPALNALIDKTYKRDGLPRGEAGDE